MQFWMRCKCIKYSLEGGAVCYICGLGSNTDASGVLYVMATLLTFRAVSRINSPPNTSSVCSSFEWNHTYISQVLRPGSTSYHHPLCSPVRQNILCAAGGVWLGGHKMQFPDVVKSLFVCQNHDLDQICYLFSISAVSLCMTLQYAVRVRLRRPASAAWIEDLDGELTQGT